MLRYNCQRDMVCWKKVKSYLRSILGDESSVTAAILVYNSTTTTGAYVWRYDKKGGQGVSIAK